MEQYFRVCEEGARLSLLRSIVESYMRKTTGLGEHCDRCLKTERWGGSVVLMIVDAAFTSIGLNYFTAVVPKVEEFNLEFVENGRIRNLEDLANADINELTKIWRNKRSWIIAKEIASYLSTLNEDNKVAIRSWAENAGIENWREDPIGKIRGVGLVTFQYLRMIGGIDTVMPDRIVKKVVNEILVKAGLTPVNDDIKFVKRAEQIARECGYRPIELCWMTWLVQPEGRVMRMKKYSNILSKI